jgi:AcrR family transcriptional regulator
MPLVARKVKRRPYDATGRRAHSVETRQRIVTVASELFIAGGYRATTVTAIAARAQVNPDTVYALVGPKPALLRELIEQAVSGTDRALPPEERDYVQQIRAEPDARRKLALYAGAVVRTQQRLAPLYKVIREAAPSQPEVAELWHQISERRLANMHAFIEDVARSQPLRPGLTVDDAAHYIWTLNSPDVFLLHADERQWPPEEIREWLARTWELLLFP